MTKEIPQEGDYVKLQFDPDPDKIVDGVIKGRVIEVDTDPEFIPWTEMTFSIDEGQANSKVIYAEGHDDDDEYWSNVTRYSDFSGSHHLGDNAEWRLLE